MKKSDFRYELPLDLIAQQPLPERSASRMLVLPPAAAALQDGAIRDLPTWLAPGDLLVFNDTRVLPARLYGHKATGGRVEVLIERVLEGSEVRAQLGVSKSPKPGSEMVLDDGTRVAVLGRDGEFYRLRFESDEPLEKLLERIGRMPLPPYMTREPEAADAERYQTVFARAPGAVAAPTAGLHFDQALLAALRERGVEFGHITLHVGAGTFQPMRAEEFKDHVMHSEWLNVGASLCERIRAAKARGGRVVAVGTTALRALEAASADGALRAGEAETDIFIYPGYRFRQVDALVTNFHLPRSTLLMLISAFAGRERVLAAYREAVREHYRFFSYGDAMFIERAGHGDGEA